MTRPSLLLVALGAALALGACRSRVTGNEGNLAFSYVADDRLEDFNKPIAVGARLDLRVEEAGRLEPVPVVKAESATPETLAVVGSEGSMVTVEGKAAGTALLQVEATVSGQNLSDSVDLLVAVPEVLKLHHTCSEDRKGLYFTGQRIFLPFDMQRANGQPVIGYGFHPIAVEPAAALTVVAGAKDQAFLHLDTGAEPVTATLSSTIDDTTLEVELVSEGAITGGRMFGEDADKPVRAGHKSWRIVWPTVGETPVCQPKVQVEVTGTSPEICAVSAVQTAREDDPLGTTWGWVEIDAQKPGTCTFDVTWPGGADGAGVTAPFEVSVQ